MGWRDRLLKLLSRGAPREENRSERVEIAVVRLPQAPLLVRGLRELGFDATFDETVDITTRTIAGARIMVPRGKAEAASTALDRLR